MNNALQKYTDKLSIVYSACGQAIFNLDEIDSHIWLASACNHAGWRSCPRGGPVKSRSRGMNEMLPYCVDVAIYKLIRQIVVCHSHKLSSSGSLMCYNYML